MSPKLGRTVAAQDTLSVVAIDWAAWFGSAGTIAAVGVAIAQIGHEVRVRRRNEERSQAVRVSAWLDSDDRIVIANASDIPVYDAVATVVLLNRHPSRGEDVPAEYFHHAFGVVPPGRWYLPTEGGWRDMSAIPGCELAFTDAARRHWIRRAHGDVEPVPADPATHYGMGLPVHTVPLYEDREPVGASPAEDGYDDEI